jgi:uncharacterized membrane protein YtjA (UPF0391 family)
MLSFGFGLFFGYMGMLYAADAKVSKRLLWVTLPILVVFLVTTVLREMK